MINLTSSTTHIVLKCSRNHLTAKVFPSLHNCYSERKLNNEVPTYITYNVQQHPSSMATSMLALAFMCMQGRTVKLDNH